MEASGHLTLHHRSSSFDMYQRNDADDGLPAELLDQTSTDDDDTHDEEEDEEATNLAISEQLLEGTRSPLLSPRRSRSPAPSLRERRGPSPAPSASSSSLAPAQSKAAKRRQAILARLGLKHALAAGGSRNGNGSGTPQFANEEDSDAGLLSGGSGGKGKGKGRKRSERERELMSDLGGGTSSEDEGGR